MERHEGNSPWIHAQQLERDLATTRVSYFALVQVGFHIDPIIIFDCIFCLFVIELDVR